MLYQGGSCVSGMWLLVVLKTVLMDVLPLSHGMLFMPRSPSLFWECGCFLNSNVDRIVAIVSMQIADLLDFDIVTVARQLCLWVSYSVPVVCFSVQGLLDIIMTTTNFLLTSNNYRIKEPWNVWSWSWRHCRSHSVEHRWRVAALHTEQHKSKLWSFEMLVTVNSQHSKYFRWLEDSSTLL